ncbi:MAG: HDOD domain-containing protein [Desulfurivibrionaceae bacterium]
MSRVEEILADVDQIPPFPRVARRVVELFEDPDVSADHLARVIQYDQAITANIMKMCNAAYFGSSRKIFSIREAVVILGHNTLKDLIMAGASVGYYEGAAGKGYKLEEGELWNHSVAAGLMAKLLSRYADGIDQGSAFTTGLLHDIGKRFMSAFVSEGFERIVEIVERKNCSFVRAEQEVIGINHAELGAIILEKWEFPVSQIEAVRNHHNPSAQTGAPLTALIALSDNLVISTGSGVGLNAPEAEKQPEYLKELGISQEEIRISMSDLILEMDKARELVDI